MKYFKSNMYFKIKLLLQNICSKHLHHVHNDAKLFKNLKYKLFMYVTKNDPVLSSFIIK